MISVRLKAEYVRSTSLHVRQCVFRNGKHLYNVAFERALDVIQVDLGKIFTYNLLGSIVDEPVDDTKFLDVLSDSLTTSFVVHQIASDRETLLALFLKHFLGVLGVLLLLWKVDYRYVGPLSGKQNCD